MRRLRPRLKSKQVVKGKIKVKFSFLMIISPGRCPSHLILPARLKINPRKKKKKARIKKR